MGTIESAGWLIVRLTFGLSLALAHGASKVFTPGKIDSFAVGVGEMGFPLPTFFAWCAALSEFLGGLLIALGLATRPAALFVAFAMVVALYRHRADPFGKAELALLFFAIAVATAFIGGGKFSLDRLFKLRLPFEPRS